MDMAKVNLVGSASVEGASQTTKKLDAVPEMPPRPTFSSRKRRDSTKAAANVPTTAQVDVDVLVNVGHPPDEEDIFLTLQLARAAKPHQVGGIRFLCDNVVENLDQFSTSPGDGCILAHSMGLGKTFQICAFSEVFLRNTKAKTVLIIVPINTIHNWVSEFNSWLPPVIPTDQNQDDLPVHPRSFSLHVLNDTKDLESRSQVYKRQFYF